MKDLKKSVVYYVVYCLFSLMYLGFTGLIYLIFKRTFIHTLEPGMWLLLSFIDILIFSKRCNKSSFYETYAFELEYIGLYLLYAFIVLFIFSYGLCNITIICSILFSFLFYALAPLWDFLGLL